MTEVHKPRHDIFISYSRKDEEIAKRLNSGLQARGVRTLLDQKDIEPGSFFEKDIFSLLRTSKCYGILLTPNSLTSKWVSREYEYARDLHDRGEMRIIPLLFDTVDLPAGLSSHSVIDFRNKDRWAANLNLLTFPGITGKHLDVWFVNYDWSKPWALLETRLMREHGALTIIKGDILREWRNGQLANSSDTSTRVVAAVDLFGRPGGDEWRIQESVRFLFELRESTRAKPNEVVFVLFHDRASMKANEKTLSSYLEPAKIDRLRFYFYIDKTLGIDELNADIDATWIKVFQELMKMER